ncbi:MAG: DUF1326 domain-containing protein [Candidatus Binataceae bacterium]
MAEIPRWSIRGDWFDVCSCNIACPCEFAQAPTNNVCEGVLAYHVTDGVYGKVQLNDLNVIIVSRFEGNIWAGEARPTFGVFIDSRADERQRESLQMLFTGKAGGFIGGLLASSGELRGPEFVPISFEVAADLAYWRAEIEGKVTAHAEALSGPTTPPGKRVQLLNSPGSETGPGQVATWGKAVADRVNAYGFRWDWSGKSSKHIPFNWKGPD